MPHFFSIKLFTARFNLLCCLYLLSSPSIASQPEPFLTRNESPFSLIFGLPLASSAKLLNHKESRWISSLNISNTINSQSSNNENLFIDVETWNINFLYDYSFKENWMLRIQLPYIVHSAGMFDSAIDAYHQALGFPEGIRPSSPNDQINIDYNLGAQNLVNINNQQSALGDVSIQMAWQAQQSKQSALSYWLSLKLPSGDANKLTGSGAFDIATWAAMNYQLSHTRWLYGQAGALYMGDSDLFKNNQKNVAAFGNAGIKFQPWDKIALKAQLDFHSAFYDSNLEFLGDVLQLTFGGSYAINNKHTLDFAVAEDIKNSASPDVNFNISWWIAL